MRFLVATLMFAWGLFPVAAIDFRFQSEGYFCENEQALDQFISSYVVQGKPEIHAGCGLIKAGENANLLIVVSDNEKLLGKAIVNGRQPATPVVFFTVVTNPLSLSLVGAEAPAAAPSLKAAPAEPVRMVEPEKEFKTISPRDVRNTPGKWMGRDIRFANVQIYWVDDDDVRILTGANVTLFSLHPLKGDQSVVERFRQNCETEREATSSKCRANVRFSYIRHSEDSPGGLFKRTVLVTTDATIEQPQPRRKR